MTSSDLHTEKTVKYLTERGSNVHLCSLDLSKAFEKFDRYILFEKLIKRNYPAIFIAIIEKII